MGSMLERGVILEPFLSDRAQGIQLLRRPCHSPGDIMISPQFYHSINCDDRP